MAGIRDNPASTFDSELDTIEAVGCEAGSDAMGEVVDGELCDGEARAVGGGKATDGGGEAISDEFFPETWGVCAHDPHSPRSDRCLSETQEHALRAWMPVLYSTPAGHAAKPFE